MTPKPRHVGDSGPTLKTARLALRWTPPEARGVPTSLIDSEGAWYALASTLHVIQYNTEQVPPAYVPPTYDALRHPGYLGRLSIEELSLTWLKGLIETRGLDTASDLIRGLAQQAVTFRRDPRSLGDTECSAFELGLSRAQAGVLQQVAFDELAKAGVKPNPRATEARARPERCKTPSLREG